MRCPVNVIPGQARGNLRIQPAFAFTPSITNALSLIASLLAGFALQSNRVAMSIYFPGMRASSPRPFGVFSTSIAPVILSNLFPYQV